MTMKMLDFDTAAEKVIFEAAHEKGQGFPYDGVTYDNLIRACETRGEYGESTIRHTVPKMVDKGILVVTSKPGAKPLVFKPYDLIQERSRADLTPPPEEILDAVALANLARTRASEIIAHIDERKSWRTPRRIRSICRREIAPFVQTILALQNLGYHTPAPWDYSPFWGKRPRAFWDGLTGSKDISGTIRICRDSDAQWEEDRRRLTMNSTGKEVVHPNLLEWRAYLSKVIEVLESPPANDKTRMPHRKSRNAYLSDGKKYTYTQIEVPDSRESKSLR